MSNHLMKAYNHGSGSRGASSYSYQSCWMSRWTQAPSKQGTLVASHSQSFSGEEGLDHRQKRLRRTVKISSDTPRPCGIIRAQNFRKQNSDDEPFCFLGDSRNGENTWASGTPMDPSCSKEGNSPSAGKCNPSSLLVFTAHESADSDLQPQSNLKTFGNFPIDADNPSKVMVFERHFSDNNLTNLDQGRSKYSAILVRKRNSLSDLSKNGSRDMQDDPNSEFFACQPLEGLPCSVRNVKTMKICTNVDSVMSSHTNPPLFSQTRTHNFLFTKQTGVNPSKRNRTVQESTKNRDVKIQPLWSSTDNEKDNVGDAGIHKGDRSHDLSAETDTMALVDHSNKNDSSSVLLPPIVKHTMTDRTLLAAGINLREDKVRGKLPVIETPDTNSTDGSELGTSRTQSLDVEHLLPSTEQISESKSKPYNKERSFPEPSSRWVNRLKLSFSEIGEPSSHDKTQVFFNKPIKRSRASSDESSLRKSKSKSKIFQCSWIQRWCQGQTMALHGHAREGFVICESDGSKLPFDELGKKQFPSIAALALTGTLMDEFRPCKLTKRGPLVVWNTEEH